MTRILEQAVSWLEAGHHVAIVSVTEVDGSTPRPLGPAMVVRADGVVAGSVSAGCVDGEAHALALEVIESGESQRRRYGPPARTVVPDGTDGTEQFALVGRLAVTTDAVSAPPLAPDGSASSAPHRGDVPDDLLDLGPTLVCGGAMTVEVERVDPADLPRLRSHVERDEKAQPLLLVYGASDVAADLAVLGRALGRRVTVCDHRPVFATPERCPAANEVVLDRPHRHLAELIGAGDVDASTAIVCLAHDARIEDPLLHLALTCDAGYVGALGSRRTHAGRLKRLRSGGLDDAALDRLRGPAGLDLGGVTSAETALSILAEIVAHSHGGSGEPLSTGDGAIHGEQADERERPAPRIRATAMSRIPSRSERSTASSVDLVRAARDTRLS